MPQLIAVIKDEFKDQSPDRQYPKWTAYVGEDRLHLEGRMRNKGCSPSRYDWTEGSV